MIFKDHLRKSREKWTLDLALGIPEFEGLAKEEETAREIAETPGSRDGGHGSLERARPAMPGLQ